MNVVVLTTAAALPQEFLGDRTEGVRLRFVTLSTEVSMTDDALVLALPKGIRARLGVRIDAMLQSTAVLRMILRASPLDRGMRFWRIVRSDRRVGPFIREADLLVAADRDANLATWHLARQTRIPAVSGNAAATRELEQGAAA